MGNTRTLQPFTKGDPRAIAAGKKGAEVRRQKREAQQLVSVKDADAGANIIATLTAAYDRETLGASTAAAAQHLVALIAIGVIPIRDGTDAANLLKVLFDMTRLEEGQHTSAHLSASIDSEAIVARIETLRSELTPPTVRGDLPPSTD